MFFLRVCVRPGVPSKVRTTHTCDLLSLSHANLPSPRGVGGGWAWQIPVRVGRPGALRGSHTGKPLATGVSAFERAGYAWCAFRRTCVIAERPQVRPVVAAAHHIAGRVGSRTMPQQLA